MTNSLKMRSKLFYKAAAIIFMLLFVQNSFAQKVNVKKQFRNAGKQVSYMLSVIDSARAAGAGPELVSPRSVDKNKIKLVRGQDWTSGFFPGELWLLYEYTGDKKWLAPAKKFTASLESQKFYGGTHDLGFMIYCSFGNGYRLTGDTAYKAVIIQAAKTLSTRFNPVAGVIKSWDFASDSKWKYPVIIDNMMNLELLFAATKFTGDSSFYKIAISHANTTIKNHFRANNSSYHVIDYDPATGAVRQKITAQGYSDSSSWARGQAWGLYGYTMTYRETKNSIYLEQAEKIADYILSRLPADKIPYWDHDAPGIPNEPMDASAAAITASALYELHTFTGKAVYRKTADQILQKLCAGYLSPVDQNHGFILLHSTGHKPAKSEIDVPLIYADYYFLEALMRSKSMK
ncbi:MAG TPA: glycoside hydrolase family 88 protein [Ferruginibacter sp.]|nr:glycoside hydrolase family 88 protein [Ferruginibacter sp.]